MPTHIVVMSTDIVRMKCPAESAMKLLLPEHSLRADRYLAITIVSIKCHRRALTLQIRDAESFIRRSLK